MKNEQKTVYILGAGFSKSYHPQATPLMADFLTVAKNNHKYLIEREHSDLAQFIYKYFGRVEYHDIEKVMSFLSVAPLDDYIVQPENRPILYDKLVQVIQGTLSWIHLQAASGYTRHAYECFADHLIASQSSVVSFNYDLLLDSLLYGTGKWMGFDGYGADIPSAFQALPKPSREKQEDYIPSRDARSKMYLIKPHGSINWGTCSVSSGSKSTIYQDPHGCYHKGFFKHDKVPGPYPMDCSVSSKKLPLSVHFKPFLVPPVMDKSTLLETPTLRVIWNIAREAIANAEKLVFIGYSLPVTDFATEFLLRQAVRTTPTKDVIVVAPNPNDQMKARYLEVFGDAVVFFNGDTLRWFESSGVVKRYTPIQ